MSAFQVLNKDAFMIMHFECSECNTREQIWNSRDGVVHYNVVCRHPACKGIASHVDYHKNIRRKHFTPRHSQRYFADLTKEKAIELAMFKVESMLQRGIITQAMVEDKVEQYTKAFYKDGKEPDLLTWNESNN